MAATGHARQLLGDRGRVLDGFIALVRDRGRAALVATRNVALAARVDRAATLLDCCIA